jgi:NADH:ubiquinone reductase (non-electrogenic)
MRSTLHRHQTLPYSFSNTFRHESTKSKSNAFLSDTIPLRTGRPRLVVLGTGWAAARLVRDIDPKLYDITVSYIPNSIQIELDMASDTASNN